MMGPFVDFVKSLISHSSSPNSEVDQWIGNLRPHIMCPELDSSNHDIRTMSCMILKKEFRSLSTKLWAGHCDAPNLYHNFILSDPLRVKEAMKI